MTCLECGADAVDGLCAVCRMEYARRDLTPPVVGWYDLAGNDTEYARTDEPREQLDCCPDCGSRETHYQCWEDEAA